MDKPSALVIGATGLTGRALLDELLQHPYYKKIIVLSRRPLELENDRLEIVVVQDFFTVATQPELFDVEDIYCCLGTTIKQAGSREKFRQVDLELPLLFAELAGKQPRFKQFLVISSLGANAGSPIFYNKVKGQLEKELKNKNLPSLKIFQPSLLLGKRQDVRVGEEIAKVFTNFLSFFLVGDRKQRVASIYAKDVARAMFKVARWQEPGLKTYKPRQMVKISGT